MDGLNLRKGGGLNLDKQRRRVRIGMAWEKAPDGQPSRDVDVSVVGLRADRKVPGTEWVACHAQLASPNGEIKHGGDQKNGAGTGDDETVVIDLVALPQEIVEIAVLATIHDAVRKRQDWAICNAVATLYDDETNEVLGTYVLGTDYAGLSGLHVVSLHREPGKWRYEATGTGTTKTLGQLLAGLGVEIDAE